MILILLIVISGFASCNILQKQVNSHTIYVANDSLFSIVNNQYSGKDTLVLKYFSNNILESKGRYAINNRNEISRLKIGTCIEYFKNGQSKSIGKYDISTYIDCCTGGLCRQFLNYKRGEWIYYYPSGQIKAKGYYDIVQKNIRTNCGERDTVLFHEINKEKWECYNATGSKILMTDSLRLELERITIQYKGFSEIFYLDNRNRNELVVKSK